MKVVRTRFDFDCNPLPPPPPPLHPVGVMDPLAQPKFVVDDDDAPDDDVLEPVDGIRWCWLIKFSSIIKPDEFGDEVIREKSLLIV